MSKKSFGELREEWHNSKNFLELNEKTVKDRKYWWVCSLNHSFEQSLKKRIGGANCPYCSGKKVLSGYNDLKTRFPTIAQQWDYSKNTIAPNEVLSKSNKQYYFKCSEGHLFIARISNLTRKDSFTCPYCLNKRITEVNPQSHIGKIIKEYSSNNSKSIENYSRGSSIKVEWRCSLGHSWNAPMKARYKGKNCPYCTNKKIDNSYNSLEFKAPSLANEYSDDNHLKPSEIYYKSSKKYLWNCSKCFRKYEATASGRFNGCEGCPNCFIKGGVSQMEKEMVKFISTIYSGKIIENDRKILRGKELDIYPPEVNVAFEFNGDYWHSTKFKRNKNIEDIVEKHLYKLDECSKRDISLYFVWERDWKEKEKMVKGAIEEVLESNTTHPILTKITIE